MNKIIRYFPETSMSLGHKGLEDLAKKNKVNMKNLGQGEFLIFVNKRKNALKMFTAGGMLAHLKVKGRIDLRTIQSLPNYFNGTAINYSAALAKVIEKDFKRNYGVFKVTKNTVYSNRDDNPLTMGEY